MNASHQPSHAQQPGKPAPDAGAVSRSGGQSTVAVVLGAGQGTRMGATQNKIFLPLGDRPILVRTLQAFEAAPNVDEILLVAHPGEIEYVRREILAPYPLTKVVNFIAGGATRHQSEQHALDALRGRIDTGEIAVVLIHDGARPFVTPEEIDRVVDAVRTSGAAILAAPLRRDELLLALGNDGQLQSLNARTSTEDETADQFMRAQTPQGFAAPLLLRAYDRAAEDGFEGTDTAAALERLGVQVTAIASTSSNFKITTSDDLLRAEALLDTEERSRETRSNPANRDV